VFETRHECRRSVFTQPRSETAAVVGPVHAANSAIGSSPKFYTKNTSNFSMSWIWHEFVDVCAASHGKKAPESHAFGSFAKGAYSQKDEQLDFPRAEFLDGTNCSALALSFAPHTERCDGESWSDDDEKHCKAYRVVSRPWLFPHILRFSSQRLRRPEGGGLHCAMSEG